MLRQNLLIAVFLTGGLVALAAQSSTNEYLGAVQSVQTTIDWRTKQLTVRVQGTTQRDTKNRLSQISRQEDELRSLFAEYLSAALDPIQVDSRRTVKSIAHDDPDFELGLRGLADAFTYVGSQPRPDLQGVTATWSLGFFPALSERVGRLVSQANQPSAPRQWAPEVPMTSIVIYAPDKAPWFGMNRTSQLYPCLYPEIVDETGAPIYQPAMVDPKVLKTRGSVIYLSEAELKTRRDELGTNPYYVRVRSVYGIQATNPLVSNEDATTIRLSRSGRSILEAGKVFIVIPEELLQQNFTIKP